MYHIDENWLEFDKLAISWNLSKNLICYMTQLYELIDGAKIAIGDLLPTNIYHSNENRLEVDMLAISWKLSGNQ